MAAHAAPGAEREVRSAACQVSAKPANTKADRGGHGPAPERSRRPGSWSGQRLKRQLVSPGRPHPRRPAGSPKRWA